jgi:phosphoenolpyruvate carboxykinase (ATP)
VKNIGTVVSRHGLDGQGLGTVVKANWNLGAAALYEAAIGRGEAQISAGGALIAYTGQHTGRSPKDKFIVKEGAAVENVAWGEVNAPMTPAHFEGIFQKVQAYLADKEVFIQDCHAGADPAHRLKVRVVTENAWHNLFARNMFLQPSAEELADFAPEFTIIQAPGCQADPAVDGTNTECFVLVSFDRKLVLIGGTSYAGEIKKSVFSILNYLLPEKGVMPMHCSANIGPKGDTAIFFGLSGTGKTTLSADGSRTLIGDDEHGWSDRSVFNFEGGCYAKVIRLSAEAEPEIYATTRRFGTVLENVKMDPDSRELDLESAEFTENTRSSYPIEFIPNVAASGTGALPRHIIMLTADAFGVLPPISKLTPEQAMYHFLSGYTARVAGTEKGLGAEPSATFSTCFGAPFMPRHPSVYAALLGARMTQAGAQCWLVNTGWTGGKPGVGSRMKIAHTRAMINAALNGGLERVETLVHPDFRLAIPTSCPGVPDEVLDPRNTWSDKAAYDATAQDLAGRFEKNFRQFNDYVSDAVKAAGIFAKETV